MAIPNPSLVKYPSIREKLLRPALTSHYECLFNPPGLVKTWLGSKNFNYNSNQQLISLSCSEASLPGSSLMTNEINDDFTGVTERHAYRRQYDDRSDFTFYVDYGRQDGNYNVLWFFEQWLAYIAGEEFQGGLESRKYYYRVRYPENYLTEVYINKFERTGGGYLRYKFIQAYPISIASMPVSYESSQLLKCTVSFTYSRYVIGRGNSPLFESNSAPSEPRPQTPPSNPTTVPPNPPNPSNSLD